MIHEINPNEFKIGIENRRDPVDTDRVFLFDGANLAIKRDGDTVDIPTLLDVCVDKESLYYLFMIDDVAYYGDVAKTGKVISEHVSYEPIGVYREVCDRVGFAIITAWHILGWRRDNTFCGRCGEPMEDSKLERARVCPKCKNTQYPKICPAVTTAIIDGDKICLAKAAAGAFRKFALIAGYVEVGESFEETVKREVFEEVGLKVKDITYYKSQPWGITSAQMIGFFARLDGSNEIHRQESELSEARWFTKDEIDWEVPTTSLSYEMIDVFMKGKAGDILDGKKA